MIRMLRGGHFKIGMLALRNAKLRSFWTMFGVIIGVTSVITVVGIGEGIKQQISSQLHHMGSNLVTVRPGQLGGDNNDNIISGFSVSGPLSSRDIAAVTKTKGVAASAPLSIVPGTAAGESGAYSGGFVLGTSADLPGLLNQSMAYGDFFTHDDMGTNSAVLGSSAVQALFKEDVPLGSRFRFHGQEFIVKGIFNQFNTTPLSQQADLNNAIFIPNDVAEALTKSTAPTYEILARPSADVSAAQLADRVKHSLDQAHGGQSNFSVLTGNQNVSDSGSILDLLTRLIAGVAAISLLVGGIGIMNVMLVSVAERTHEIGIRKAVGATNRQILNQFMIESSTLSLIGGLIGVAAAFVIDGFLRLATHLRPQIGWQIVVVATGISLLVGVVFGSVPALKAARKDPIDALRSE